MMLAYINKIVRLEFEQRVKNVDSNQHFQEHKPCHEQQTNHTRNIGTSIQRLGAKMAKKFA